MRRLVQRSGAAVNLLLGLCVTLALLIALEIYAGHRHQQRYASLWSVDLESERERVDPGALRFVDMIQVASNEELVYELRPSLAGRLWGVRYRFNSLGMRDRETRVEKPPGIFRIALLGDSYAFSWGVAAERGYPELLERRLRDAVPGKRVEVLNFGVPGYNLAMKAASLEHKAMAFDPDLILLEYYENDPFLPNFLLEPDPPTLHLLAWIREAAALGSDRAGAPAAGRLRRARYLQDPERVPAQLRYMVGFEGVVRALERVRGAARAAGIPLVLVVIRMPAGELAGRAPDDAFFGPDEQRVAEEAERLGYVTVNTLAAFLRWAGSTGRDPRELQLSRRDPHPSPLGHQILARAVEARLRSAGLLPGEAPVAELIRPAGPRRSAP